ncbi:MAG: hypothetical protein Q9216_004467 [Gyalolechia sp. 2 TL-2023]
MAAEKILEGHSTATGSHFLQAWPISAYIGPEGSLTEPRAARGGHCLIHTGSIFTHFDCPTGTIEFAEGCSSAFKAEVNFGADWCTFDADKQHGRLNLKVVARTADGASISLDYHGVIRMDDATWKVFTMQPDAKTMAFGNATGACHFVVGDKKLKALENNVFAGNGRIITLGKYHSGPSTHKVKSAFQMTPPTISILSRACVQPDPPLSQPRSVTLGITDNATAGYSPPQGIWFYAASEDQRMYSTKLLIGSLRQTLASYPHFAGRLEYVPYRAHGDWSERFGRLRVVYGARDDPGVETVVIKMALHDGFETGGLPATIVKITTFACGGIAITPRLQHVLGDAQAFLRFVHDWAAVHRSSPPAGKPIPWNDWDLGLSTPHFVLHYSADEISKMYNALASSHPDFEFSRLDALIAHLWAAVVRARAIPEADEIYLEFAFNFRQSMVPPLPENLIGVPAYMIHAKSLVELALTGRVRELALTIRKTIMSLSVQTILNLLHELAHDHRMYEVDFGGHIRPWFVEALIAGWIIQLMESRYDDQLDENGQLVDGEDLASDQDPTNSVNASGAGAAGRERMRRPWYRTRVDVFFNLEGDVVEYLMRYPLRQRLLLVSEYTQGVAGGDVPNVRDLND